MKKIYLAAFLAATLFFLGCVEDPLVPVERPKLPTDTTALKPFPQAGLFSINGIRPNRTQELMNSDVIAVYRRYRDRYLGSAQGSNGQILHFINATGTSGTGTVTISEAHGYAMLIFALMAGSEGFGDEKEIFDGLNRLRRTNPSTADNRLMSWTVYASDLSTNTGRSNAATDGCLDMAYALLLAYRQWGEQSYLNDARNVIRGLRESTMHLNNATHRTKLGDWHSWDWGNRQPSATATNTTSRTSDWRPSHFRAFAEVDDAGFWLAAADTVYALLGQVSHPITGLMPDFIIGVNLARAVSNENRFNFGGRILPGDSIPDRNDAGNENWPSHFEALVSGEHNWGRFAMNAARTPWFIAKDYLHHGTPAAKNQLSRITSHFGIGGMTASGYTLEGDVITTAISTSCQLDSFVRPGCAGYTSWSPIFAAPFASAAAASGNQSFVSSAYNAISGVSVANNEYAMAIQLLNMLLITGNWWIP